jgi:hypothetical protein
LRRFFARLAAFRAKICVYLWKSVAKNAGMRSGLIILVTLTASSVWAAQPEPRLLDTVRPLPVSLDPAFQFRKTKIFHMTEQDPTLARDTNATNDPLSQATGKNKQKSTGAVQDASITFERQYRLFGAVTKLDQHQRFGDYFDFFWRARNSAAITVRLEYRQEKLRAHVQAQEVFCGTVRGGQKTSFKVVGDDYFDNGRVLAWRCLLIENGTVVAENHSYLWR